MKLVNHFSITIFGACSGMEVFQRNGHHRYIGTISSEKKGPSGYAVGISLGSGNTLELSAVNSLRMLC